MKIIGVLAIVVLGFIGFYFLVMAKAKETENIQTSIQAFDRTKISLTRSNMETIKRAVIMQMAETGRVPNSLKNLRAVNPLGSGIQDAWGTIIRIKRISSQEFRLISAGGDLKFDTDDDIVIEY